MLHAMAVKYTDSPPYNGIKFVLLHITKCFTNGKKICLVSYI